MLVLEHADGFAEASAERGRTNLFNTIDTANKHSMWQTCR